MKIFFEKVSCNVLPLTYKKTAVSFTEARLIFKLGYQFFSRGLPVQSCFSELFFRIFLLSIKFIKLWTVGLIGIKIIFPSL